MLCLYVSITRNCMTIIKYVNIERTVTVCVRACVTYGTVSVCVKYGCVRPFSDCHWISALHFAQLNVWAWIWGKRACEWVSDRTSRPSVNWLYGYWSCPDQLVEQGINTARVAGSIPTGRARYLQCQGCLIAMISMYDKCMPSQYGRKLWINTSTIWSVFIMNALLTVNSVTAPCRHKLVIYSVYYTDNITSLEEELIRVSKESF